MTERDVVVILREWRDEFALAHGYHLAAMVKTLRALDRAAGDRLIRGEPRRPSVAFSTESLRRAPPTEATVFGP